LACSVFCTFLQFLISFNLDPDDYDRTKVQKTEHAKYFIPALRRIEDEIYSKKESLASSSAWKVNFKRDLERLPVFRSYKEKQGGLYGVIPPLTMLY